MLASPEVARAKCVPLFNLHTNPVDPNDPSKQMPQTSGVVSMIIVPRSEGTKPMPTQELINRVKTFLEEHVPATATVEVVGPFLVEVTVITTVAITATYIDKAGEVERTIQQKLAQFLHPLTGGFDHQGWMFGRRPQLSDLYRLIEGIAGVDHVCTLQLQVKPEVSSGNLFMIYSGQHEVTVQLTTVERKRYAVRIA
jgi:hypothetical protein